MSQSINFAAIYHQKNYDNNDNVYIQKEKEYHSMPFSSLDIIKNNNKKQIIPSKPKVKTKNKNDNTQKRLSSFFKSKITENNKENIPIHPILKNYRSKIPQKNSGLEPKMSCDSEAISKWVYLTNKQIRDYQLHMVEVSLYYNTLVCLPTGLGKTYIAAVVMLNYYRWFPNGKIFFLAPTRPLVNQQKEALIGLKNIDENSIVQLNGNLNVVSRKKIYADENKRVFFMTPQTLENDMAENRIDLNQIVLIVFDEAHRATGDYAYCKIIRLMEKIGIGYRILALSATPGNTLEQVQEVVNNLCINKLEIKDDQDSDVKNYLFLKQVVPIVVKKNDIVENILENINVLIDLQYKNLKCLHVMDENSKSLLFKIKEINRTLLMQLYENFKKNIQEMYARLGKEKISKLHEIFNVLTSLLYGKNLIATQGISSFYNFLHNFSQNTKNKFGNEIPTKKDIISSSNFSILLKMVETASSNKENHPKLIKLSEILQDFFSSIESITNKSKVIIFTQSRSTANEINCYLKENKKILPSIFIGQSGRISKKLQKKEGNINNFSVNGLSQKEQIQIIKDFKENRINTLIATCVGEEGLDIGDVDLIVCYDSGFSPIRMVQRRGRTGRFRDGKVIILLMEGKEYNNFNQSQKKSEVLMKTLKKFCMGAVKVQDNKNKKNKDIQIKFYPFSPRMIPDEIIPKIVFEDPKEINEIKSDEENEDNEIEKEKSTNKNNNYNPVEFNSYLKDSKLEEDDEELHVTTPSWKESKEITSGESKENNDKEIFINEFLETLKKTNKKPDTPELTDDYILDLLLQKPDLNNMDLQLKRSDEDVDEEELIMLQKMLDEENQFQPLLINKDNKENCFNFNQNSNEEEFDEKELEFLDKIIAECEENKKRKTNDNEYESFLSLKKIKN